MSLLLTKKKLQSHWVTYCFYILACILLLVILIRSYYNLTDDFRMGNIHYQFESNQSWKTEIPSKDKQEHLREVFNQTFSYLGKGAQSYAFQSEDGHYVIKFFKFKHLKPSWWIDWLPSLPYIREYKENLRERKQRKLVGVFNAYHLAYEKNRENAQLVYLHLVPTNYLHHYLTIKDKIGFTHTIDLDHTVFLLQKMGETFRARMERLIPENRIEEAKSSIYSILNMYVQEYGKGLYDRDHGVMQNTGFVGSRPFHLDVGKVSEDPRIKKKALYKRDLMLVAWKIDYWIKQHYPEQSDDFAVYIKDVYMQLVGELFNPASITYKNFKKHRGFLESERAMQ